MDSVQMASNDIGIKVENPGNLILRNTASQSASGECEIAAGNSNGPTVTITGVGDISATPTANHPWANFVC